MKCLVWIVLLLAIPVFGKAQDPDRIYAFMNQGLPGLEPGKPPSGIFFLSEPYVIDTTVCRKIMESGWTGTAKSIQEEFYKDCSALDPEWQKNFRWEQSEFPGRIIVQNTTDKINLKNIRGIRLSPDISSRARFRVRQWNRTNTGPRLVDYSSVPLFSSDGNYVLIVRGQDAGSDGGWDTLYIYKRTGEGWKIAERIVITAI